MNRITVMLDDSHVKKVRDYQIKMMKKTEGNYSFSEALRDLLEALK